MEILTDFHHHKNSTKKKPIDPRHRFDSQEWRDESRFQFTLFHSQSHEKFNSQISFSKRNKTKTNCRARQTMSGLPYLTKPQQSLQIWNNAKNKYVTLIVSHKKPKHQKKIGQGKTKRARLKNSWYSWKRIRPSTPRPYVSLKVEKSLSQSASTTRRNKTKGQGKIFYRTKKPQHT
jgi:hypothetical protein